MPTLNLFKRSESGTPNGFNQIYQNKDVQMGVSKIVSRWPFPDFSTHPRDELLIVLRGEVEVEYEKQGSVHVYEGDMEVMPKSVGHKVNVARGQASLVDIHREQGLRYQHK